ncbi:MAG TPA: heme exporter protein CcmB [Caulobacter sp.]|nr:heme exporter protein CcmB [Caulobacter sp.]
MRPLIALIERELALGWGRGGGPLPALGFYAAITVLLPLAGGSDTGRLAPVAVGVAWMALALASLLSLERLFERDFEDGGLDLLMTGPAPLELVCAVKCLSQWITTGAPLALAAPVAAVMLGAPLEAAPLILACSLAGGLAFAFVGGIGAALALGSRRGGLLVAAIVLPLFSPPVIFGGAALQAGALGTGATGGLLLLLGWTLAAVGLSPLAMAAACRNAVG